MSADMSDMFVAVISPFSSHSLKTTSRNSTSSARRSSFPFHKRSMPFSRHFGNFLTINEFFSTKLKKKENL